MPHEDPTTDRLPDESGLDNSSLIGTLAVIAFAIFVAVMSHRAHQPVPEARPTLPTLQDGADQAFDPAPFLLNALLVPALDPDSEPLRWVDPRPVAQCGPATAVLVDRKPLVAGTTVPDRPFTLEWQADDCHPFGRGGPRLDGRIRLDVFHEGEFGAIVTTSTMRATLGEGRELVIAPRWLVLAHSATTFGAAPTAAGQD
jgi:hypothetical protein